MRGVADLGAIEGIGAGWGAGRSCVRLLLNRRSCGLRPL